MPDWNELFKSREYVLDEPHPVGVRFVERLAELWIETDAGLPKGMGLPESKRWPGEKGWPGSLEAGSQDAESHNGRLRGSGARVLDLGCGAGRHLLPLLAAGHLPLGTDIAPEGLRKARERMELVFPNRHVPLLLATMLNQPFADASFDGVLTVNVLNHGTLGEMRRAFEEIHRILKPGGLCSALVIADEDHRCGHGTRLEERTYVPTEGIETGIPHHFSNKDDLLELTGKCAWQTRDFQLLKKHLDGSRPSEQDIIPQSWGNAVDVVAHWEVVLKK